MVLSTVALLKRNPEPTREEVLVGLRGNLCRCTGYVKILDAVEAAQCLLEEQRAVLEEERA
jgi:aerobic-type carbon monoxide dehydrogenase small subunit (CoxS/CutS family)